MCLLRVNGPRQSPDRIPITLWTGISYPSHFNQKIDPPHFYIVDFEKKDNQPVKERSVFRIVPANSLSFDPLDHYELVLKRMAMTLPRLDVHFHTGFFFSDSFFGLFFWLTPTSFLYIVPRQDPILIKCLWD